MKTEKQKRDTKMESQCLNSDIISTLPQKIIRTILTLMPLRDALRTSVLSKKWRYSWRNIPKLSFTETMIRRSYDDYYYCEQWKKKYQFVSAIFHVLLFHNGPTIVRFDFPVGELEMESEFDQIFMHLARLNNLKEVVFVNHKSFYRLPVSFFSLQGLEIIELEHCVFELPSTFKGFSRLKRLKFFNVIVSDQMPQRFFSKCPLLEYLCLWGDEKGADLELEENKFTYVDLLQCVPVIRNLKISHYYMKCVCADDMPQKLPTSLAHLEYLNFDVCLMEQDEISSALFLIKNSPVLKEITIQIYGNEKLQVQQISNNYLDPKNHSDLKLDHLETLEIERFSNLPLEIEFVKLIVAKSPMLEKVQIEFDEDASVDKELTFLRCLVQKPLPYASPFAELIIKRP